MCVCAYEIGSEDKSESEERSRERKEMTHSGGMIQQEAQNRAIISQPVVQRGVIIIAHISAAAVLLSI